ncbi:MAG: hypothetical protein H0U10_11635 [Chloroflexia bacterium]|nr:hypothetical protein [Chloroflexia bacterium]
MFHESPYRLKVETAIQAVTEAAAVVLDLYERQTANAYAKEDGSPVTDADLASDRIIRRILGERQPGVPILTEEGVDQSARLGAHRVWIADPIDGTQQFVERTGNFDVLLALVEDGRPVVGVALQPTTGRLCLAVAEFGAWVGERTETLTRISLPDQLPAVPAVGTSVWFGAPMNLGAVERIAVHLGGEIAGVSQIGLTPRIVLEPRAFDLLVGFRSDGDEISAAEWDFAVGDLFLHEAGGRLTDLAGRRLAYNKATPRVGRGFVAAIHPALHERALEAVARELPSPAAIPKPAGHRQT